MSDNTYFGWQVFESKSRQPSTIGVIINEVKMLDCVYETAKRIAAAGPPGLSVDMVPRSNVQILKSAGVNITSDALGMTYRLAEVPRPDRYMVEVEQPAKLANPFGQYGGTGIPKTN